MRMWLKAACVVLAWSVVPIMLVAAVTNGSAHRPAQANTRTQSNTKITLTSTLRAAAPVTAPNPRPRYVVHDGDTLSGIAARFAVRGGWPALYAANRSAIGPDPGTIHPGTVLVLPGPAAPARYTVAAGDTLSGIAARFAVRGGWPALYAANRSAVGPNPGTIRPGTVLALPRPGTPNAPTAPRPARPASNSPRHPRRLPRRATGTTRSREPPGTSPSQRRKEHTPRACRPG